MKTKLVNCKIKTKETPELLKSIASDLQKIEEEKSIAIIEQAIKESNSNEYIR